LNTEKISADFDGIARLETYHSLREAKSLADRLLPGARVFNHWGWRYTLVWTKGEAT
jgi:hypothetical protein